MEDDQHHRLINTRISNIAITTDKLLH